MTMNTNHPVSFMAAAFRGVRDVFRCSSSLRGYYVSARYCLKAAGCGTDGITGVVAMDNDIK